MYPFIIPGKCLVCTKEEVGFLWQTAVCSRAFFGRALCVGLRGLLRRWWSSLRLDSAPRLALSRGEDGLISLRKGCLSTAALCSCLRDDRELKGGRCFRNMPLTEIQRLSGMMAR